MKRIRSYFTDNYSIVSKLCSFIAIILLSIGNLNCYHSKQEDLSPLLSLIGNANISITMLGDSLAERSNAFNLNQKLGSQYSIKNISRSGWDVPRWLNDKQKILANKSDIVIVGLVTNDAYYYPTDQFPDNYNQLIRFLEESHNWKIVLTLAPPSNIPGLIDNIQTNNEWIQANYPSYTKVDLFRLFEKNNDKPLYPSNDPLHPNPIGYELIGEAYRRSLLPELSLD